LQFFCPENQFVTSIFWQNGPTAENLEDTKFTLKCGQFEDNFNVRFILIEMFFLLLNLNRVWKLAPCIKRLFGLQNKQIFPVPATNTWLE
jgi:hypothetical protein